MRRSVGHVPLPDDAGLHRPLPVFEAACGDLVKTTNRVFTHDQADSFEHRGRTYCLRCLRVFGLVVDPDTEHHERVYHLELPAGLAKASVQSGDHESAPDLEALT